MAQLWHFCPGNKTESLFKRIPNQLWNSASESLFVSLQCLGLRILNPISFNHASQEESGYFQKWHREANPSILTFVLFYSFNFSQIIANALRRFQTFLGILEIFVHMLALKKVISNELRQLLSSSKTEIMCFTFYNLVHKRMKLFKVVCSPTKEFSRNSTVWIIACFRHRLLVVNDSFFLLPWKSG